MKMNPCHITKDKDRGKKSASTAQRQGLEVHQARVQRLGHNLASSFQPSLFHVEAIFFIFLSTFNIFNRGKHQLTTFALITPLSQVLKSF